MTAIRAERAGDESAIRVLLRAAFQSDVEPALMDRLRERDELLLSLVAVAGGRIIGHIGFAPAAIRAKRRRASVAWLVPLAVAPSHQGLGIGGALVRAGLGRCRALDFDHAIVVGDPKYYCRFGFAREAARGLVSRWPDAILVAPLSESAAKLCGEVIEPTAFAGIE